MGLAGRKQKQRIPEDPRNLSWADDASRFGLSYLSKFGWDTSQGLGASGEGMRTHLKVQQKLDMMGIGTQHQRDPNGIAWKQNKEFEALLKRLNEGVKQESGADGKEAEEENMAAHEIEMDGRKFVCAEEESLKEDSSTTAVKKRKHRDGDEPGSGGRTRKKRGKEMVKRQISGSDISAVPTINPNSTLSTTSLSGPQSEPLSNPCPMAHRARIRAAKRIVDKSASAISEILGIAPSSSVSTSTTTPTPTPSLPSLDNLTTSTKSVADYFKEKLLARSTTSAPLPSPPLTPSDFTTSGHRARRLETGLPLSEEDDSPRRGIGSRDSAACPPSLTLVPGLASSDVGDGIIDEETLTEKMRRKADRKAEKRKRRTAEAICESSVTAQAEEGDAESLQRTPKKEKRKKEHRKYQQMPVDGDGITETSSIFPPESTKRFKRNTIKRL